MVALSRLDGLTLYSLLIFVVILQRLLELVVAKRNLRRLLAEGAKEAGAPHYPVMVAIHTGFLASCIAEPWLLDRPLIPPLALSMLAILVLAGALRVWAIRTLGGRWTTRVITLEGAPRITAGPYRYLSHPNYLAVRLEILALPLVHSAWITAIVFTVLNAILLRHRVKVEEKALAEAGRGVEPSNEPRTE